MTGPHYRTAVRAGDLLFVSGQLPLRDGVLVDGGIVEHAEQALANLDRVLQEHGASRAQVVKVTVLLADVQDWDAMNGPYRRFFGPDAPLPARTAYGVGLRLGARVEVEAVAHLGAG